MANDTIWNYVNDFITGRINRKQFWALAEFKYPTHQISFHTLSALNCLSFEQVSDEVIEHYGITAGDFDTITDCKYAVPSFMDIGKLYSIMIEDCAEKGKEVDELMKIFSSFISDKISDFQTDVYYQNPSYLECSYREGYLLD